MYKLKNYLLVILLSFFISHQGFSQKFTFYAIDGDSIEINIENNIISLTPKIKLSFLNKSKNSRNYCLNVIHEPSDIFYTIHQETYLIELVYKANSKEIAKLTFTYKKYFGENALADLIKKDFYPQHAIKILPKQWSIYILAKDLKEDKKTYDGLVLSKAQDSICLLHNYDGGVLDEIYYFRYVNLYKNQQSFVGEASFETCLLDFAKVKLTFLPNKQVEYYRDTHGDSDSEDTHAFGGIYTWHTYKAIPNISWNQFIESNLSYDMLDKFK